MAGRLVKKQGKGKGKSRKKGQARAKAADGTAKVAPGRDGDDVAAPLARWFLWADSPLAVQRVILGLGALCAVLFLFDLFWHRHAYVPGEGLWGFHAIAGFVSFTVIVLGAKALRTLIRRDEDYYGEKAVDGEAYPDGGLATLGVREGEDAERLLAVRDARVVGRADGRGGRPTGGRAGSRTDGTTDGSTGGRTDGGHR